MVTRRARTEADFTRRIDALTHAAIAGGVASFPDLLRALPSVYPVEALESLGRLTACGSCSDTLAAFFGRAAATIGKEATEGRSLLPVPHPLDYEWRFTPDAARSLLDCATGMTPAGGDLLLFGTPGLAVEAMALPVDRRVAFLAEKNSVTDRVVALNGATGSPLSIALCNGGLPRESADAVLLDPPWYLDFIRPMLAAAAHAVRHGGVVLMSLAPDATRPSAGADRTSTIHFASRLGLEFVEHDELAIAYETPFFERNALTAAGIYPSPQWRRGDLLVFRKSAPPAGAIVVAPIRRREWTEVAIGRMRVMFRMPSGTTTGEAGLISYIEGDVLPTVSRRDRRRSSAQVWTSGNRVFRTDNPQLVLDAALSCSCEAVGSGVHPRLWGTLRDSEALDRVAEELRGLAALEAEEERGLATRHIERSTTWRWDSTNSSNRLTATSSG